MASHRRRTKHFSRASKPRRALLRGLMESLVEHGRITTTVDRAKETRRHIEKAITVGKKGDVAAFRTLLSRLSNKAVVQTIVKDLSVRFKTRPGGYTRIIKIGRRPGDTAEMAFIEFVDYDWKKAEKENEAGSSKADKKDEKSAKKAVSRVKKATVSAAAAKRKTNSKIQKKSRAASRA